MLISTRNLFELKYQKNSIYFDKCLAEIFLLKCNEQNASIIEIAKYFYHAYSHDEMQCTIKFDDNSMLLIEKNEKKEWSQITIYSPDYLHAYKQFVRKCGGVD